MTTNVKATGAGQFLSLIPRMLGFHPRESLVIVPFAGTRSLGAMRYDLPDGDLERVAATIVGLACRVSRADALALSVWSTDAVKHADFADAIRVRADACGLMITDSLWCEADEWGRFGEPDRHPRPSDAHDDTMLDDDQAAGSELPSIEPGERSSVEQALVGLADAVRIICGPDVVPDDGSRRRVDPLALTAACALDDLPTLFETALAWDPETLAPYDAATLAWCLARPSLRDIALVQWCRGLSAGDEALDAQLRWEEGEEFPEHIAEQMWGEGDRPDSLRLESALEVVRRVAASAPESVAAGSLATAGWIAWALGRSTHASAYADAARALEPEHGLAEIIVSFVKAGHVPDWAFEGL